MNPSLGVLSDYNNKGASVSIHTTNIFRWEGTNLMAVNSNLAKCSFGQIMASALNIDHF